MRVSSHTKPVPHQLPRRGCDIVTSEDYERLDEHGHIVPGLGDAGDRLYGVV
jgi:uracil phosphoribosyltransferase